MVVGHRDLVIGVLEGTGLGTLAACQAMEDWALNTELPGHCLRSILSHSSDP
jgi:hypothetical protein